LYFTRDEKGKSNEDKRTTEENFELANEAIQKMDEATKPKNRDSAEEYGETMKKIMEEKYANGTSFG
jgi:non-homologous end joining protein Ku